MIKQIKIELEPEKEGACPSFFWGSLMHGVIMESLDEDVAASMHLQGCNPISQYVIPEGRKRLCKKAVWTINVLDEDVSLALIERLEEVKKIHLSKKNLDLRISSLRVDESISEEEFCRKHLVDDEACRRFGIEILTPCSHKSAGKYSILPREDLLINSLVRKWNQYASKYRIEDAQAISQIIERTSIRSYNLKSLYFHLEGVKIPAFIGSMDISASGPEPLRRLLGMLVSFSEISGIGIKTALGMGAVKITKK